MSIRIAVAARFLAAALLAAVMPGASPAVAAAPPGGPARRTENLILVTLDGVRNQELFSGMDRTIASDEKASGIYDLPRARRLYWRDTAEERRRALMPFFWGTLAPRGMVLGDVAKGSSVRPRNRLLFSAPGYAEILTGRPQPEVTSNEVKSFAHRTFLQEAQARLGLDRRQVAVVGSWDGFGVLASSEPRAFFSNTGYEDVPADVATPRMTWLSEMQHRAMALWEEGRSDAVTFGLAIEYLKAYRPRVLYVALDETDDWAHARRYDRLLDDLHVADGMLRELWETVQGMDGTRDRTTIIVTTDHGRGDTPEDWVTHDQGVRGSENAFIAVVGPDTPARGEWAPSPDFSLSNVAGTALDCLGLDPRAYDPEAGAPIAGACAPGAGAAAPAAAGSIAAAAAPATMTVKLPPLAPAAERSAQVDALFRSWIADDAPGAAVLVVRDGGVEHRKGYGLASLRTREPIGPRTMFDVGSVSKQFTALAIEILAERGRLGYDDPVRRFFPEFHGPPAAATVRDLLHHTSGLEDYMELFQTDVSTPLDAPMAEKPAGWTFEPTARDVVARLAREDRLRFAPGEDWEYSNSGYTLLGQIAGAAAGEPLPRFLKEEVFGPLGMNDTLVYDETRPVIARRATSYEPHAGGFRPIDWTPLNLIYGDGNVNTDLDDMTKWCGEIDRATLVSPDTRRLAFTSGELQSGERTGYGFGWAVTRVAGLDRVSHTGAWVGFRALVVHYPSERLTFVVLSNRADFSRHENETAWRLSRLWLGDRLPLPAPVTLDAKRLAAFAGRYRMGDEAFEVAVESGALRLTAIDDPPPADARPAAGAGPAAGAQAGVAQSAGARRPSLRLLAESDDRFFPEGLEGDRYLFDRDDAGAVTGFRRRGFLWGYGRGTEEAAVKERPGGSAALPR